jgi:YVTN family beta-propeller protein
MRGMFIIPLFVSGPFKGGDGGLDFMLSYDGSRKIIIAVLLLILAGCAGPEEKRSFTLFYPEPPELPRLQWLTAFTGAKDIEPERSAFDKFVVGEEAGTRRLDKPYGVAMHNGKIYVCDTNKTVTIFDLGKKSYGPLKGAVGPGKLLQPVNVSIDKEDNKYVSDPVRGQVVIFDRNDAYVRALGEPGTWKPVDAVVLDDRLYVADMKNGAVVVMDKTTGAVLKKIGRGGDPVQNLYMPTNLAFDKDGDLYVSDSGKFAVLKFDRDGHYKGAVGKLGTNPGSFARPKGIAVDRENRLYVVDASFDNVQVFSSDRLLLFWFGHFGKSGRNPGELYLPAKAAIDYDDVEYFKQYADPKFEIEYIVLVTSQFGDNMVNVFGYGKEKGKHYPSDAELKKQLQERLEKMRKEQPKAKHDVSRKEQQ